MILYHGLTLRVLVCKSGSNDDVGDLEDAVLEEIRPGADFKTSELDKEKVGGLP